MNNSFNFHKEIFNITSEINFAVQTAVFNGNKICQLKTLEINYKGKIFKMVVGTPLHQHLIQHGLRTINSVELINYLNKIINGDNLFEVYNENTQNSILENKFQVGGTPHLVQDHVVESKNKNCLKNNKLEKLILHQDIIYDIKRYKDNLIDGIKYRFIKSELIKTRNPKYPTVYHNFDEINVVPMFCCVHPSLATNRKETIIICHLGYILEKLASYKSFPEFNTQAMISFMNMTNTVHDTGASNLESLNKYEMMDKIKSLMDKNNSLTAKINQMQRTMNSLNINIQELNETNKSLNETNKELHINIQELNSTNNKLRSDIQELNETNQELIDTNQGLRNDISSYESKIESSLELIQNMFTRQTSINKQVQKCNSEQIETIKNHIPPEVIGMKQTHETIMFIYSPRIDREIRLKFPKLKIDDDEIILNTISCQTSQLSKELRYHKFDPETDKIYIQHELSNSLDINKFMKTHSKLVHQLEAPLLIRKFAIKRDAIDLFIAEFNKFVEEIRKRHEALMNELHNSSTNVNVMTSEVQNLLQNYIQNEYDDRDHITNEMIWGRVSLIERTIQANQTEIMQKINENQTEVLQKINEIQTEVRSISDRLRELDRKVHQFQIKLGHYYYDVRFEDDGSVSYATKRDRNGNFSNYVSLTEDILNSALFRDKDHIKNFYRINDKHDE